MPTWNTSFHEYAVERGIDYVAFVLDGEVQLNVTKAHRYLTSPPLSFSQLCAKTGVYLLINLTPSYTVGTRELDPQSSGTLNGI